MIYRDSIKTKYSLLNYKHLFTDILVGFLRGGCEESRITADINCRVEEMYDEIDNYCVKFPDFKNTLEPWNRDSHSQFITLMTEAGRKAGVGPMATVAGVFSDNLLDVVLKHTVSGFIENGGDIALYSAEESDVLVYGKSEGFETSVGFKLKPGTWGIASSSGRYGRSMSLGQGDMVSVVCRDCCTADAWATAICNRIVPGCNPEKIVNEYRDVHSLLIIWQGKLYYRGDAELFFR